MTTLFIADLHLTPDSPQITDCFVRFMREEAVHADALYVLGDLFEFWIGDDDSSPFATQILAEFRRLTQAGVACYFTRGNRDFLVGKRFAQKTGVTLLGDETVIDLYGRKAVVLHGDTLCTRDVKYLEFRAKVNQPWLQWLFNHLPFFIRRRIVANVQSQIKDVKQGKSLDIMDVTPPEVDLVLDRHKVDWMIHGHTHRPAVHDTAGEIPGRTRVVLGDWYQQGSVLVVTPDGFELQQRPFQAE
ncbi:UDP-2,3-diacylglucosamine diphosphatase [Vibrio sp.]|uniref:UDP-2,3-diacylglucosamine diphosphatase n=1 Tax=Vibrio sp. TaxID=678 RepID=UPI003D13770B